MSDWTPPSKHNTFCKGDIVVFRNSASSVFEVDHVEANMVFIKSSRADGRVRIVDFPASDFMLLSEWKRIYANG